MVRKCDHTSVGVIVHNGRGELALLERGRFPVGVAPPAGHADEHGTSEQAAVEEVFEELGIVIALGGLRRTSIQARRVDRACRRPNGDYHVWDVYEANVACPALRPDPIETNGAAWQGLDAVQRLADRTRAYQTGTVNQEVWAANPGLEEVWLDFFVELGYVQ